MYAAIKSILIFSGAAMVFGGFVDTAAADTEANKAAYRRINQEAWSQGHLAVVDEFVALEYVYHEPALGDVHGPEGLKQTILGYRTAYPDLNFTIDDMIAEGDLVALRWSAAGTQKGEMLGIPATGLATTTVGINIVRFQAGRIVEEWSSWDMMGLMQQLGVVQPPRPGPEDYLWTAPSDITGAPGTPAENKLLVLRVKRQFWTDADIAGLDDTHHANAIAHNPNFPGPPSYEAYRDGCLMYLTAFPDLRFTVEAMIAEGDEVAVRWTATGTQQGELLGMPASGKTARWAGMTIYRVADGKVAETWWAYDALGLVQQITSPPEYSPVGTWIVTVPTPDGNITLVHIIHPQDATGVNFGGIMYQVNANPTLFGLIPEGEQSTPWATQTTKTGPNTFETSMVVYTTKKGEGPVAETVTLATSKAIWTITGPDTNEGSSTFSVCLAAQDADGDGLADPGQQPTICMPFTYTSKRLTAMPDCVPTPMPSPATP